MKTIWAMTLTPGTQLTLLEFLGVLDVAAARHVQTALPMERRTGRLLHAILDLTCDTKQHIIL